MDSKQKLEINIKAAKLLNDPAKIDTYIKAGGYIESVCDIFNRSADREATMIALGENWGVSFSHSNNEEQGDEGWWFLASGHGFNYFKDDEWFDTYTEALAAAVGAIDASA